MNHTMSRRAVILEAVCNDISFKSTNTLDADDCCLNIQAELNESNFEELSLNFILPQLSFQRFNTKNYLQPCASIRPMDRFKQSTFISKFIKSLFTINTSAYLNTLSFNQKIMKMKKITYTLIAAVLITLSATAQSKITKSVLEVDGLCGMCKERMI